MQKEIEDIKQDVGVKRKSAAMDHVKNVKRMVNDPNLPKPCRDAKVCAAAIAEIDSQVAPITQALKESMEAFNGSDQERIATDNAYVAQEKMSKALTVLEEQMIPAGYTVKVPDEYSDLPQLKKRATVEMVFKKPNNEPFDVNGQNYKEAKMKMIIDGYTGRMIISCFYLFLHNTTLTVCRASQHLSPEEIS